MEWNHVSLRYMAVGAVAAVVGCDVPPPQSEVPRGAVPAAVASTEQPRVEHLDAVTGGAADTTDGESTGVSALRPPQLTAGDGREAAVREDAPATGSMQTTVPPSAAPPTTVVDTVCARPELTRIGSYIAPRANTPVYVAPREQVPVASIAAGTPVMVVDASGDWLLVRFSDLRWGPRVAYMHCSMAAAVQDNGSPNSSATAQAS